MKALVIDNTVIQIEATPFEVHKNLKWVDCNNDCKVGWIEVDGKLSPPIPPIFSEQTITNFCNLHTENHLNYIAKKHGYANSTDIINNIHSANDDRVQHAKCFIKWRDEIKDICISFIKEALENQNLLDDISILFNKFPEIKWPK